MLTETQSKLIDDRVKENKKALSKLYAQIEISNKLKTIVEKYDLSVNFFNTSLYLRYTLGKQERVSKTAWQIFEEIDEVLETESIDQRTFLDSKDYDITALKNGVQLKLVTYYGLSEACKMVKVTKTIETHKLICED